ncbi:PEP-CTERM sorting domain-containing protein [Roseateles sp.]|uniref:PEP-CTERM sorting domain-containing protein n=1 Tax=Roseateles sp. TaxID=1971397 RepID=UPI00326536F6
MNKIKQWGSACAVAAGLLTAGAAHADVVSVSMTVDNSYAFFTGNLTSATTFVGTDANWPSVESYNFNLASNAYLYVVTASDKSTAQGFLGQFENITNKYKFYSNDPQWQVMSTGLGSAAPYDGTSTSLALLSAEIQDANGGGNPSLGWQNFTAGGSNGAGPWGTMSGIDAAARWVWYGAGNCSVTDPTIGGCDAGEWLVFRIAVAATPDDPTGTGQLPEPASLALVGLGLLAACAAARRRRS